MNCTLKKDLEIMSFESAAASLMNHDHDLNRPLLGAIRILQSVADPHYGMNSHSEQAIYQRVATPKGTDPKAINAHYAIIGLNYLEAASHMIAIHNKSIEVPSDISEAKQFIELMGQCKTEAEALHTLQLFCREIIVPKLETTTGLKTKEIIKLLEKGRDFNNLDMPPKTIVSTFSVEDSNGQTHRVTLTETPMSELTPELLKRYREFQSQDWYIHADAYMKAFIEKACLKIVAQHDQGLPIPMIPTQLRSYLPGLRNAYKESIKISPKAEAGKDLLLYEGYHFGNPGHLTAGNNLQLTELSQAQFKAQSKAEHTFILTLVSPNNPFSNQDDKVTRLNMKASTQSGVHFANTPLNMARVLPKLPGRVPPFQDKGLAALVQLVDNTLQDGSGDSEARTRLTALRARYDHYRNGSYLGETGNRNLELAIIAKQMAHSLNEIHGEHYVALGDACMSGKDRSAIVRGYNQADVIDNYFKAQGMSLGRKHYLKSIAETGHLQTLAGYQGATLGAHGIKSDSKSAIPKQDQSICPILLKSPAKLNKHLPHILPEEAFLRSKRFKLTCLALGLVTAGLGALFYGLYHLRKAQIARRTAKSWGNNFNQAQAESTMAAKSSFALDDNDKILNALRGAHPSPMHVTSSKRMSSEHAAAKTSRPSLGFLGQLARNNQQSKNAAETLSSNSSPSKNL